MELYLDSVNLKEIASAIDIGIIAGLTTTPTFMHREGIEDVDSTIVELSKQVPILQRRRLGNNNKRQCKRENCGVMYMI